MVRKHEHRRLPNSSIEISDILLPWSRNCLPLGTFAARKLWRRHHCQLISPLAHILRLILHLILRPTYCIPCRTSNPRLLQSFWDEITNDVSENYIGLMSFEGP